MDTVKCIRCGSENHNDYKFCVNCGAVLPQKDKAVFTESPATVDESFKSDDAVTDFDGVSTAEMTAYVKTNQNKILPKFYSMEKYRQKVSFCFPVFILGLLFGLFGISMWCFYRKMKKLGLISLVLGLVLVLGDLIVNFNTTTQFIGGYSKLMLDLFSDSQGFSAALTEAAFDNLVAQYDSSYIRIFSFLNQYVGGFICPVLMGMFGLHLYKIKAVKDIKELKGVCPEELLLSEIAARGGTSKGLLAIPIIVYLLTFIVSFIVFVISFLSVI